uniref:PIN domain-containing protein n=1 Tax=Candidatus Kentrum sp. SD TaxID=2126332 RepID=A0A450Y7M2_9GAMM|nr:MAG: hypothetical protein BECKSD772F_GA0070984_101625 [Candidatus Kentron sp. SD]VFK43330.1 MAG: hypothetical protein BECKSD772E_GA0070983_102421 [Candidatus Kentron sp. SD]
MILVDTSIRIEHLRQRSEKLSVLLGNNAILIHPFVIGELACGNLRHRRRVLAGLYEIPLVATVSDSQVMEFVEDNTLFGVGIGWIDAHLLAAAAKTDDCQLWTRDKRLRFQAERLNMRHY